MWCPSWRREGRKIVFFMGFSCFVMGKSSLSRGHITNAKIPSLKHYRITIPESPGLTLDLFMNRSNLFMAYIMCLCLTCALQRPDISYQEEGNVGDPPTEKTSVFLASSGSHCLMAPCNANPRFINHHFTHRATRFKSNESLFWEVPSSQ